MQPPSEIDGASVLKVAELGTAASTGRTRHYRDGEPQTGFRALALARYEDDSGVYLFYCDEDWNCLNDTYHSDIAAAEAQAATEFDRVTFVEPCLLLRLTAGANERRGGAASYALNPGARVR